MTRAIPNLGDEIKEIKKYWESGLPNLSLNWQPLLVVPKSMLIYHLVFAKFLIIIWQFINRWKDQHLVEGPVPS